MSYSTSLYLNYLQYPELYEMLYINEFFLVVIPDYKSIGHNTVVKTAKEKVAALTKDVAGLARKVQSLDQKIAKYRKSGNRGAVQQLTKQKQALSKQIQKKIGQAKLVKAQTKQSVEFIKKQQAGREKLNKAIVDKTKQVLGKVKDPKEVPVTPTVQKTIKTVKATTPKVEPITTVIKKTAPKAGEVSASLKKAVKTTGKIGLIAGGSAAAAYGGYKLYQRYLSKAAKHCKGKVGAERTLCIKQYMQARRKK